MAKDITRRNDECRSHGKIIMLKASIHGKLVWNLVDSKAMAKASSQRSSRLHPARTVVCKWEVDYKTQEAGAIS